MCGKRNGKIGYPGEIIIIKVVAKWSGKIRRTQEIKYLNTSKRHGLSSNRETLFLLGRKSALVQLA